MPSGGEGLPAPKCLCTERLLPAEHPFLWGSGTFSRLRCPWLYLPSCPVKALDAVCLRGSPGWWQGWGMLGMWGELVLCGEGLWKLTRGLRLAPPTSSFH